VTDIRPYVDFALDMNSDGGGDGTFSFNVLTAPFWVTESSLSGIAVAGPVMFGGNVSLPTSVINLATSAAPALTVTSGSIDEDGNVSIALSAAFEPTAQLTGRFLF
jgi:hypothetical protein